MKKHLYSMTAALLLLGSGVPVCAQTLLDEGFETGSTTSVSQPVAAGEGWTTVNSYQGTNASYVWHNYYSKPSDGQVNSTITGSCVAACDAPIGSGQDGAGPREEILLTPELNLDNTYELQFTWRVSPMNHADYSRYDLQVRIVTDGNLAGAETVFSLHNQNMLKESGVLDFPIDTWDPHTSKIDLSDWKGEKVKIAFVYKMYTDMANVVWLDDVSVKQFTPPTGPVATLSMDRYNFGEVYIGEKLYSEVFTLTNTGKKGLKVSSVDLPAGVGLNIDPATIDLDRNDKVQFQLYYEAAMTSAAQGDVVLHTTGGDAVIAISATKQFVPEGTLLENFNAYYPPAGWRSNGWGGTNMAIEGDMSAFCSGAFSVATLRSPRLDLTSGGKLRFTYFNQYDGETAPEYDIEVQVSYDGGDNWQTKWTSDYMNGLNQLLTAEVDLGIGTDESYVRWYYPAIESDDEGAFDHSSFTLDRVLLPHVYGAEGVPSGATVISPANGATGVYPRDIVLQWGPAQFAKGYKLYVGSNDEVNNIVDGLDLGQALTYTLPRADYETVVKWRVVAYNDKGDATTASTWHFTTQPDASVVEFPYVENFDELTGKEVPQGWLSTTTAEWTNRRWEPLATAKAYGGKGVSLYTMWLNAGKESTLLSPEFRLPADGQAMNISFVWGDNHPVDLIVDETGLLKKQNVEGGNGYSDLTFEILADGQWQQAAYLSENYNDDGDTKYWRSERIDLTQYAGKTVQFRWTNHSYGGSHRGAALDEIVIDGIVGDLVAFNKAGWQAGKVNYGKSVSSGDQFTLLNKGTNTLRVKQTGSSTGAFTTTLQPGTEIAPDEGVTFAIEFSAGTLAKTVSDEVYVEFENGYKASLPVEAEALAQNLLYYGFEPNPMDYEWKQDFTTIDADRKANYELGYHQTVVENDGQRYAFAAVHHMNDNLTAHSGAYTLGAAAPYDNSAADDWLISKQMRATETSTFDFYARDLGTLNSVFIGDNDLHSVGVYVSETGNTKTTDFTAVMRDTEMAYLGENEWHHFTVDLSKYAGKDIYVAVRHTTISANWMAFFDDFTFTDFLPAGTDGIDAAKAIGHDAQVEVYSISGTLVAAGKGTGAIGQLASGVYVVKVKEGDTVRTMRIARR